MRLQTVLALSLAASIAAAPAVAQEQDRYWELGVGAYLSSMAGLTELDVARYDWVYVCFGNIRADEETAHLLERMLQINPELKIVLRIWPIMSKGDRPENRYQATFWHYLYDPEVKQAVDEEIARQFHVIAENISRPENIVGMTFLEELPGHFSGRPMRNQEVSWAMERFREEIEQELGRPLVWDDETALWWGEKWVEAINEIHRVMKEVSDGRLVWYYQAVGYNSFDRVPEGTPPTQRSLVPIHWSEIIQPGLCDGFFAYPNNATIWRHFTRMARENDWLFFGQLSHPAFMRLCSWDESIDLSEERMPQNMGYFLYCPGDCAIKSAWNDDPQFAGRPEQNIRGVSQALHQRQILAGLDVGMEIVRAQPALRLLTDLPLDAAQAGGFLHVSTIVENSREASFFVDPNEAAVERISVTLTVPDGFKIDTERSAPATVNLGALAPGERRIVDWWVSVGDGWDGALQAPFSLSGSASQGGSVAVRLSEDSALPLAEPREIGISGAEWIEPGFRLARDIRPAITIEALADEVRRPSISDGRLRLQWEGTLRAGQRLVLHPEEGSRLFVLPLLDDEGAGRADADDPTGFRAFDDGYSVVRLRVEREVEPGQTLRVALSGKAEDGAQSHAILRFVLEDGSTQDVGGLTNQFSAEWRKIERDFTVPEGATRLQQVFLYRFNQEGSVWYGPVSVDFADADAGGIDVGAQVTGGFPAIRRGGFTIMRYEDDDLSTLRPRVRLQLQLPED